MGDITLRALDILKTVDVIAAEDSRRFHRLASDLGVSFVGKVISFFDGNAITAAQWEVIKASKNTQKQ